MSAGIARDAATAAGFGDRPPSLRLTNFRSVVKGSLRGFANIEWDAVGLVLKDVSIHVSNCKAWAGLPAAPVIDSDGRHHVVDGKKQYRPLIEWKDRDRSDRFQRTRDRAGPPESLRSAGRRRQRRQRMKPEITESDAVEQFRRALESRDIAPPHDLAGDGKLHRCDAKGRGGKPDTAYLLHLDGLPAGGFENHRDGHGSENWRTNIGRLLIPPKRVEAETRGDAARAEREADITRRRTAATARAAFIWQQGAEETTLEEDKFLARGGVLRRLRWRPL